MKILTIGRGDDCDVIISDSESRISRRHALLRIYPLGKMELIPLGRNGTFKNGNVLKDNAPHVVKKGDVISFAHVKQLDWKQVKNPYRPFYLGIASGLGVIMLLLILLLVKPFIPNISIGSEKSSVPNLGEISGGTYSVPDSTQKEKEDSVPLEKDTTFLEQKPRKQLGTTRKQEEMTDSDATSEIINESTSPDKDNNDDINSLPIIN